MGSYLSIKNNTDDTWTCTIGPDEAALKIAGLVVTAVAAAATVIGTAGAAAPVASALSANGVVSVFGVSTSALAAAAKTAESIASIVKTTGKVSDFGNSIAEGVNDNLVSNGYFNIAPVTTDTLYMRPIFSGATDNSNIDHEIQYWIDKFGLESTSVTGTTDSSRKHHHKGADDDSEDDSEDDNETIYFYSNGTVGYGEETMAAHKWKQH
ncbi:hypothetical protein BBO99_00004778 [Phytophthora kernoviae]|uniref:Uncharacterized protein n=1 Tax=Phytophthora kernoviae TaxID=325452 RepID=A0A3R7J6M8_9STRA|nr:hypothetical protein JM16_004491 [Phytophthora kernoviae]KAG2524429.1 hypothetical protein JM18_005390 [Phytophthora kernoviae]RLN10881.1 hypothetical protein BBI17_004877 [Phytophthora kernoviae]RLN80089.1 hypothetical protein BBO99_00004778 [Phytophthora kernoviae]